MQQSVVENENTGCSISRSRQPFARNIIDIARNGLGNVDIDDSTRIIHSRNPFFVSVECSAAVVRQLLVASADIAKTTLDTTVSHGYGMKYIAVVDTLRAHYNERIAQLQTHHVTQQQIAVDRNDRSSNRFGIIGRVILQLFGRGCYFTRRQDQGGQHRYTNSNLHNLILIIDSTAACACSIYTFNRTN